MIDLLGASFFEVIFGFLVILFGGIFLVRLLAPICHFFLGKKKDDEWP